MNVEASRGIFGSVLRRLRIAANISQEELAERARLSVESISALERGRRRAPYRETVRMLADALALSEDERRDLSDAAQRSRPGYASVTSDDGEPQAPAAQAGAGNLPSRPALIGRDVDVAKISALLARGRFVTILGPGGIGKTQLALEIAWSRFEQTSEPAWFIDLAPLRDPALVTTTIRTTLGVKVPETVSDLAAVYAGIGDRSMLLIMDNCEHLIDEASRSVAAMIAACPNVRVIATSREALNIQPEMLFRLPSLSVPPEGCQLDPERIDEFGAVALFVDRAFSHEPDRAFDAAALIDVAQICRRLDGIPLAIELAAAQTQTMSVHDVWDQLHQTFAILTGHHRGALPRQQTMGALIDWSYDLLTEYERIVLRRLAVFSGGWTIDAAQAVCADEALGPDVILQCLLSLVRKSLVAASIAHNSTRYRLLEMTRVYALEKLDRTEWLRFAHRHAAWAATFAESVDLRSWTWSPDHIQRSIGIELDNLRLALTTMAAPDGNAALAGRIAAGLAYLWYEGGLQAEGRRWLENALQRIDEAAEPIVGGRLWRALAMLGTGTRIVTACEHALRLFGEHADLRDLANANFHLAFGLWQVGRLGDALDATDRALTLVCACGFERTRKYVDVQVLRANLLLAQGRFADARGAFGEAYELSRFLDNEHVLVQIDGNLAELEFACGDAAAAIELADRAAAVFKRLGATSRVATARVNSAAYRLTVGSIDAACADVIEALALALLAQDTPLISISAQHIASVLAARGQAKSAAILVGYVDAWYLAQGYQRERSEQQLYEQLMASLAAQLPPAQIASLKNTGELLSEAEVAHAAQRFVQGT